MRLTFSVVGDIEDPKFEPGPLIEEVMSKAMSDKIAARLAELPRDVVKMSERAISGEMDFKEESKEWGQQIETGIVRMQEELIKLLERKK